MICTDFLAGRTWKAVMPPHYFWYYIASSDFYLPATIGIPAMSSLNTPTPRWFACANPEHRGRLAQEAQRECWTRRHAPSCITWIMSANIAVVKRWAMRIAVRPFCRTRNLDIHSVSAHGSMALVGSSRTMIGVPIPQPARQSTQAFRASEPPAQSADNIFPGGPWRAYCFTRGREDEQDTRREIRVRRFPLC